MSAALKGIGMTDVKTDCGARTCSFKAPAGVDVEAKLTEIAAGSKLEGWSKVE